MVSDFSKINFVSYRPLKKILFRERLQSHKYRKTEIKQVAIAIKINKNCIRDTEELTKLKTLDKVLRWTYFFDESIFRCKKKYVYNHVFNVWEIYGDNVRVKNFLKKCLFFNVPEWKIAHVKISLIRLYRSREKIVQGTTFRSLFFDAIIEARRQHHSCDD